MTVPASVEGNFFFLKPQTWINPVIYHLSQHWHLNPLGKDHPWVRGVGVASPPPFEKTAFAWATGEVSSSPHTY